MVKSQTKSQNKDFQIGEEVAYGLHGKCIIVGLETKNIGDHAVEFYQVKAMKLPLSPKSTPNRGEACILVPVASVSTSGLRKMMNRPDIENALRLISEPDYHFELRQPWVTKQKELEDTIRKEGGIGLAKVIGHLYVLISQDAVPPSQVVKLYESCSKVFLRELADALEIPIKDAEPILHKALKTKLAADQ